MIFEIYRGRAPRIAFGILATVMLLLANGASANPSPGEWVGKTSQGYKVNFTVKDSTINPFKIVIKCPDFTATITSYGYIPIVNNKFQVKGFDDSYDGTFISTTTAIGNYNFTSKFPAPSCNEHVSWSASLVTPPNECFGADLNGDGKVNFDDFAIFAAAYGTQVGNPNFNAKADQNHDSKVNFDDFAIFAAVYGMSCGA